MSSVAPVKMMRDRDNSLIAAGQGITEACRFTYPGGPRRILSGNTLEKPASSEREVLESWTLPVFSEKPSKLLNETEQRSEGMALAVRLSNCPEKVALEQWLAKSCLDASRPVFRESSTANTGRSSDQVKPNGTMHEPHGHLQAVILRACLEEAPSDKLLMEVSGLLKAAPQARAHTDTRGASPPASESDVSIDAFTVDSSDSSDASSTEGSSADVHSELGSEPSSARKADPPTTSGNTTSPSGEGTLLYTPSDEAPLTLLKKTRPQLRQSSGFSVFSGVASVLAYPWLAASAAANTALETLSCALAIFEDEEWGDEVQSADVSPSQGYSSSDSMNGSKGSHFWQGTMTGMPGLAGTVEDTAQLGAQKQAACPAREAETWEQVLRKRRAAKAFSKFLDRTRGKLVANRLCIPEQDGLKVPLWKRRGFQQPGSILLTQRNGVVVSALRPATVGGAHLGAPKKAGMQKSLDVAASPIWQRRAVGPPTPLTMLRRKLPQQVSEHKVKRPH